MPAKPPKNGIPATAALKSTITVVVILAAVGLIGILLHMGIKQGADLALSLTWACACFAVGTLLGFLFGIPKSEGAIPIPSDAPKEKSGDSDSIGVQGGDGAKSGEAQRESGSGERGNYRLVPNANLVEISNWLTTVVVGVSLIQLKEMPEALQKLAVSFDRGMVGGEKESHIAFGQALIVFFAAIGFLFGYLATRLYLSRAILNADQGVLAEKIEKLQGEVDDLRWHNEAEVYLYDAAEIVNRWERVKRDAQVEDRGFAVVESRYGQVVRDQLELARGLCNAVLKHERRNERANLLLARLSAIVDDYPGALRRLDELIDGGGAHPIALYNAATCYAMWKRDVAQVVAYLKRAFNVNKGLKEVARCDKDFSNVWGVGEFEKLVGYTGRRRGGVANV